MRLGFTHFFGVAALFVSVLARGSGAAPSPAADSSELVGALNRVQTAATGRKWVSVSYEQTRFKALVQKTIQERGSLDFATPRSFRWEVLTPAKEIYVSNGKDFWKYSELAKHAQKLKADNSDLAILDVLFKPGNLKNDYRIEPWTTSNADVGNGSQSVSALPPQAKSGKLLVALFSRAKSKQKVMYLVIDENKAFVDEVRIVHENGNRVRTVFGAISEKTISPSRFEFVPPAGTAVDQ